MLKPPVVKTIWSGNDTKVVDAGVRLMQRYSIECRCGAVQGESNRKTAIDLAKKHDVSHIQQRLEAKHG